MTIEVIVVAGASKRGKARELSHRGSIICKREIVVNSRDFV
ncbi:MAG: hypothetical protein ABDH28_03925 [Brevinematia bacterium]